MIWTTGIRNCAFSLCACIGVAAPDVRAAKDPAAAPLRVTTLIGREVHDAAGAVAGRVEDLFVDVGDRRVAALVLDLKGRPRVCGIREIAFADEDKPMEETRALRVPGGCDDVRGMAAKPEWRRASALATSAIRDRQQDAVGDVKDLFIDPASARVTHAVVDFDDAWYAAEGWVAVPMESLRLSEGAAFVAMFDRKDMRPSGAKGAAPPPAPPPVARADVRLSALIGRPLVGERGQVGRITELAVDTARDVIAFVRVATGPVTMIECPVGPSAIILAPEVFRLPEGRAALEEIPGCGAIPELAGTGRYVLASELVKAAVKSESGERVGSLRDVVVELSNARLHYLVADFKGGWVQDGQLVALPLRPIERDNGKPAVRASLMELQRRPVFPEKRLADVWSPAFAKGMHQYLYGP